MQRKRPEQRLPRGLAKLLPVWLLLALLWPLPPALASSPVLTLDASASRFEAWDVARVLMDPTHALKLGDVIARRDEFTVPDVPRANFGPNPQTIWLRVPVRAAIDERWIFELDYPPINRVEAWVVEGSTVAVHALMGSDIPAQDRPIRSRSHVFSLDLAPGPIHEIYLRIDSVTSVVTPIRLHREAAFVEYESLRILLLGLMFGVMLLLITMTLVNGFSMRDPAFLHYSILLIGVTMFFIALSGLGHQFMWSTQAGYLEKISPISALIALTGVSGFMICALDMRERSPRMTRCLQLIRLCAFVALLGTIVGLLGYRQASTATTLLGPIGIVLALTESVRQARNGSRMAFYMAIGWGAYAAGSLSFALLLRGLLPAGLLTQNLFPLSSMIEMFAWMRVLSIRIEALRQSADRVAAEKQALYALAHTDVLTGLLNRRGLVAAIEAALASDRPAFAVYLIDLDGFKAVNDRLGHEAGDDTLVHVGRRLRAALRDDDIIARLGGDEFVVLAAGIGDQGTAETIGRKMLDLIREPFALSDRRTANVGATIGFALAPQDGTRPDALLRAADTAMYAGKHSGRQCIRRASPAAAELAHQD
ncbi:MAG: diguanylate cyclase [Burkholderiaceae bacterium]